MPNETEFLDQLFGSGKTPRKAGEPLRKAKLPSMNEYLGKDEADTDGDIDFVGDAEGFKKTFGVSFSSTFRTPEKNAEVDGVVNSRHMDGLGADIPTRKLSAAKREEIKQHWRDKGSYKVIDEGDHIHIEPKRGIKSKTSYKPGEGGKPVAAEKGSADQFLDQLFDPNAPKTTDAPKPVVKPKIDDKGFLVESARNIGTWAQEQFGPTKDDPMGSAVPKFLREPISKKADQVLDHVTNRFLTNTGQIGADDPRYNPSSLALTKANPFKKATLEDYKRIDPNIEKRLTAQGKTKPQIQVKAKLRAEELAGGLLNPVDLILNDSLPADFVKWVSYEHGFNKLVEAKEIQQQEGILASPEKYSATEVQAARKANEARKAKQDYGVADAWSDLKKAAVENPKAFGFTLVNSLLADPEMILVPIGLGIKPVQAIRTARGITATSNATKRVDRLIDVMVTGGSANAILEAAQRGSEGENITARSTAAAFTIGGALAAPFGLFGSGAKAIKNIQDGNVTKETLDQAIKEAAQGELAIEEILGGDLKSPNTFVNAKHQIERETGVKFESEADLKAYLEGERKRWKALFKERDLNGQYQKALADERISRRETLLGEQQARVAEGVARKPAEVERAYNEDAAARIGRFSDEYEQALAQRDAMAEGSIRDQAMAENDLRATQARLDQEDIISAAMEGDVPAVRNAMLRAAQRDAQLRVPKWQRGEVDPRIVARLGIGSLFAGTAYALADKENKPGATLAAGLAGLMIPGGGSVLSKMRQAGAVSDDGMITGLFKGRDPVKQLEVDTAIIARAKNGDQTAFNELFNDNYHDIVRFANRKLAGVKGRIGMDGEDVATEVFDKAFAKINEYESRVPYNAYLKKLAKDEVVDVFRRITAEKRGADFAAESMYNKFDSNDKTASMSGEAEGGYASAIRGDVESAATSIESPEFELEFMDATRRLQNIVNALPEKQKQVFTMLNIDNMSIEEVAKALGESYSNVGVLSYRAETKIVEMLEKGYGARKAPAQQAPTGEMVKRGRGRPRKMVGGIDPDLLVKAGVGAAVAVTAATVGAKMYPKDPKKGALAAVILAGLGVFTHKTSVGSRGSRGAPSKISQEGAFKGKGGNWTTRTQEDVSMAVDAFDTTDTFYGSPPAAKMVQAYLNRYAGQDIDPLKDIVLPNGEVWGELIDSLVDKRTVKDWNVDDADVYSYRGKTAEGPDGEFQYGIDVEASASGNNWNALTQYLNHVADYLKTLPTSVAEKYDFVRAVKETAAWDKANAKKMKTAAAKSMEGMPVYREYPDGYKWVQLKRPGDFAQESDVMGHSVRGYEPPDAQPAYSEIWGDGDATPRHPDWTPNSVGGSLQYGFGGWEGIKKGDAEIYSLRDPDGMSHATIEVNHERRYTTNPDSFDGRHAYQTATGKMAAGENGKPSADFIQWRKEQPKIVSVTQIKGKQNAKPNDKYIPYIQDFVKKGDWDAVDDMQNASMRSANDFKDVPDQLNYLKENFGDQQYYTGEQIDSYDGFRRGPRSQQGSIDPALLKTGAKLAIAGLAGLTAANIFTDTKDNEGNERPDKQWAPFISGIGVAGISAFLMLSKGKGGSAARTMATAIDELFGASSTRILIKTPKVFGAIQHTIRTTAGETHKYIEATTPFLRLINKLPKETQDIIARALYTGKPEVINRILEALGDAKLKEAYKTGIRTTLDSLGDKLVNLKRFAKGSFEYFPRIIKDKDGLFNAIGKTKADDITKILDEANIESLKRSGKPLTGYEENALINSILFGGEHKSNQPGWAKNRGIEEITEELLPFYASPAESLHSYIRSAVADIEKAKFFGQYARNSKNGQHEFLDVEASVGLMMRDDLATGKIDAKDANEVAEILKDFFGKGQMGESDWIRRLKDISYMGLLGNFISTVTQLADIPVSIYTQDLRSTIGAVIRQATGRKLISAKDLGLVDNISQEFAGQERSTRALNRLLKTTLFSTVDQIGKNTSLNAAVIRAQRLAKSEGGVTKLSAKYAEIFGPRFNALVSDLKAGKISDEVRDYAWMELSRTQPISMLEMPQAYMKHPNARGYLMLKSFVMKQIDLVRRDAVQNMATRDPKKIAKGIKNLTEMTIVMGTAGAGTQMVKDWLMGKEVKFELTDIPLNMVKNLGWSEYQLDKFRGVSRQEAQQRRDAGEKTARASKAQPVIATLELALPPFRIFDDVVRGDPNAIRYVVPGVGPWAAKKLKESMQLEEDMKNE